MSSERLMESILSALSNEIRAEILKMLSMGGSLSFTEIMERLNMAPKSDAGKFGYHLRTLIDSELIASDEATGKYYLTLLGQDVASFIYGVEDAIRRKKGEMQVRTSSLTIEPFDRKKIVQALIREANVPRKLAESISKEAEERLRKVQVKYLTAALIREFVNAILLEKGLEEYRHSLTRLGQPVYDVTSTIQNASYVGYYSPAEVHSLAGDSVYEEYLLLKVLPRTIADAHLSGAIHLNNANYWILRPADVQHDLRPVLSGKLAADPNGSIAPSHHAPKTLKGALYAILNLVKVSTELVSNSQALPFFNIFLAPYSSGMSDDEVKGALRDFVYLLNTIAGCSVPVAVQLETDMPAFLSDAPVGDTEGLKYGDFHDESLRIARLLLEVMGSKDGSGKPFMNPAIFLKIRKKTLVAEEGCSCLEKACEMAGKWGTPYFVNQDLSWQTENVAYNASLSRLDSAWKGSELGTLRTGVLENITINLPRIAYAAKGNDDLLLERLRELMEISKEALTIKRQVIRDRMKDRLLPLFQEEVSGSPYYRVDDSAGVISFVGLPEAVQFHTGLDILDDPLPLNISKKIVESMLEYSKEMPQLRLMPSYVTFEPAAHRLTSLDISSGLANAKVIAPYTEHSVLPLTRPIPLKKRLQVEEQFQSMMVGGHFFNIRLDEPSPTPEIICNQARRIFETANIGLFSFTKDYTYCWGCGEVSAGLNEKCPRCPCSGDRLVKYTRVYGRYKPSRKWSNQEREFATTMQRFML
ncbi:MAG: anaerobic ribonucleoside-triphosphate reductase [Candidatus Verstraetearchaeota archaeon]|nr:anaerobic ribonucleoside-triphosphate reductase [Candidatus Verstraetearchaeota archaeon]